MGEVAWHCFDVVVKWMILCYYLQEEKKILKKLKTTFQQLFLLKCQLNLPFALTAPRILVTQAMLAIIREQKKYKYQFHMSYVYYIKTKTKDQYLKSIQCIIYTDKHW